jgi:DNA repair protein SbcD/Mre11
MSAIRIVHTADNHIGLKFKGRSYSENVRQRLVQERFDALRRVVDHANARKAHFLVVAGDLFDSVSVPQRDIKTTADILKTFAGLHVVVLPGNHDFYEEGDSQLWAAFRKFFPGHQLLVLHERAPVELEVGDRKVVFFPAPCTSKHSNENAIGWVSRAAKDPQSLNIGIAHGSISQISPDFDENYYPMTQEELRGAGVVFWLTGHSHIQYPDPNAGLSNFEPFFIPSTHTPDGFDCSHAGNAWFIEVDREGTTKVESLRTGGLRFYDMQRDVHSAEDLQAFIAELKLLDESRSLLKITMTGRLSQNDLLALKSLVQDISGRFIHCEVETAGVALNVTRDFIDKTYARDSLPHQLLSRLAIRPEDALALQLAYEMMTKEAEE